MCDELVQRDILLRRLRRVAAGQLDDVGDQPGELVELGDDAVEQRASLVDRQPIDVVQHLDVGAKAGQRRTQLMARVEDQLPLLAE